MSKGFLRHKVLLKKRLIPLILVFFFVVTFFTTYWLTNNKTNENTKDSDLNKINIVAEQQHWFEQIKTKGGEKAYQEFKAIYLKSYPKDIHYITHIFGEQLYKAEGVTAISICDSNFAFGCYHGLIVSALKEKGMSVVHDLNTECIKKNGPTETGCRHGIGHGLLEYLGHQNYQQALETCSSLQKVSPLGCTQGVFMEYNSPGMMDEGDHFLGVRKLESMDKLYEPCTKLPAQFSISCYYEQSQWWLNLFPAQYEQVGKWCDAISEYDAKKSCYLGIGIITAQRTSYSTEKTIEACTKMPSPEANNFCREAASWVFKINPNYKSLAPVLCDEIKDKETCQKNSISPDLMFQN